MDQPDGAAGSTEMIADGVFEVDETTDDEQPPPLVLYFDTDIQNGDVVFEVDETTDDDQPPPLTDNFPPAIGEVYSTGKGESNMQTCMYVYINI
jgi:hypothetical protein